MFVPLHDENSLRHIPLQFVTLALVAMNVVVFVVFLSGIVVGGEVATVYGYGMIPAVYNDVRELPPELFAVSDEMSLITYQFLHGGWMHLISNMLFLWVFGDNVEDAMGHVRFLVFYLLCGAAAALAHGLAMPASEAPLIGASGAVAGVIAAYLMLHPRVRVWVLVLWRIPLRLNAAIVLGAWAVMQVASLAFAGDDEIAWWAHIGGFAAGAVLVLVMRRRGVALFDRGVA